MVTAGRPSVTMLVTISEAGHVEQARIVDSLIPPVSSALIDATKRWRYEPATLDGQPVKFLKVVSLAVQ
jgi:TonB family protein